MSVVPSFLVQPMFEQKSGNLPIACLAHPFSVVTVETRHCLHGPKAVRILLTRFATTFSKTWHRVLRTLSLLSVSLWKYRILEVERNRNLKIPQDTITQPAPEVILKFKEQETRLPSKSASASYTAVHCLYFRIWRVLVKERSTEDKSRDSQAIKGWQADGKAPKDDDKILF